MVRGSAVTLALWSGKPDAKQAVELGFMIFFDKPIIIIAEPGQVIPRKLLAVADDVIYGSPSDPRSVEQLRAAMAKHVGVVVEDPEEP